ncbi:ficolin-3-like [Branchiostoma lanceolatum]|uniref:ficolin-3-like n=1 Tax=Branchiostoma lanceolatum TaxID=7740 RepID=UPI003452E316
MARYRHVSLFFCGILALSSAQTDPIPNYEVTEHGGSCRYSLLVEKPAGGCQQTYSPRKHLTDLQNRMENLDRAIDMAEERRSETFMENKNKLLKEEAARLAVENEITEIQFHTQNLEDSNDSLREQLQGQTAKMKQLQDQIKNLNTAISQLIDKKTETESDKGPSETAGSPTTTAGTPGPVPTGTEQPTTEFRDCTLLKKDTPGEESGVKTMVLPDGQDYTAFCDFSSPGGPWTVIQRRREAHGDKQVDFFKTWDEYRRGFGNPDGEYWIGNHALHQLTKHGDYELRIELRMTEDERAHAHYDMFRVLGADSKYQLKLGQYSGTAGDAMFVHRNQPFSTRDREHDTLASGNCARAYRGGWWYAKCFDANLNGEYTKEAEANLSSVSWVPWRGYKPIPHVEMKIRHKTAEDSPSEP